jgi:hypothetical protein
MAPARRSTWWIVPLLIVGLVLVGWLLLAGLPFGGEKRRVVATATTETIGEGTATAPPMQTGTVVEVPGGDDTDIAIETVPPPPSSTASQPFPPPATTATTPPLSVPPRSVPVPEPRTTPPPVIVEERPRPAPAPPPATSRPTPPAASQEITEAEATSTLRSYLASSNPYQGISGGCLQLRSAGYRNVGYTYAVWDSCVEGGGSRMLGRWRVDAKTREVFRQRDDGRYLRP